MLSTGPRSTRSGISVLGLPVLATLGIASCNTQDLQEFFGDVGNSTSPPPGTAIPFEEFTDDVGDHAAIETRVLIRSAQAYQNFFGHASPADIDFGRQSVIFYAAGTRPTGGFDANILSLTRAGNQLVAITELVSPGAGCAVTDSLTAPHVLIRFAAQNGASVQFFKKDRTNDCQPVTNPCAAALCPAGTHCESQVVECVTAPCPPVAVCVPDPEPVHCGGIAGIPCPGLGKCVDDPSDSCDPNAGGADCGGICQCIETVLCIVGDVFDSSPSVCACVPRTPPTCGPVCDIFCGNGHVIDANGCPTCACNPAPTPTPP
jgi:hypothetical protein